MRIRTPEELGLVIRERRRALELDQQELARRVGVGRKWVVAVEQGRSGAALGLVLRTLTALDLTVDVGVPSPGGRGGRVVDLDAVIEAARGGKR